MATKGCFHVASLLFHHKSCKSLMMEETRGNCYCGRADCSSLVMELRKKIMIFRDILDLPPLDGFATINEVVIGTITDLQGLFPEIIPSSLLSEIKELSIDQGLLFFVEALKSVKESWMPNREWIDKVQNNANVISNNMKSEQLVDMVMETLDTMTNMARKRFDIMDENNDKKDYIPRVDEESLSESSYTERNSSDGSSPDTPTSVLPLMTNNPAKPVQNSPLLLPLRLQAVGKLNPIYLKRISFHMYAHKQDKDFAILNQNNHIVEETMSEIKDMGYHDGQKVPGVDKIEDFHNKNSMSKNLINNLDRTSSKLDHQDVKCQSASSNAMNVIAQGSNELGASYLPNIALKFSRPAPPEAFVSMDVDARAAILPSPPPPMLKASSSSSPLAPPSPSPSPPLPGMMSTAPPPRPPPSKAAANGPPPPPPPGTAAASAPPPPPMPLGKGAAPPPPPPGGGARSLLLKRTTSKLKRSSQIGNLYRLLKRKVEGSCLTGKSSAKRSKTGSSASAGGKQGMADALAEMTKRSAYFQQIEADVQQYAKSIEELKTSLNSFRTKDMPELLKFHKHVESILEKLTDESQVLARFEDFPSKKVEALRTAAALYSKLDAIISELKNWKIQSPLSQLLEKVERYFSKMKRDIDALERTKDEDLKKFRSHNIEFDFNILVRIKEAMVDLSSGCMELALKERREANAAEETGRMGKQRKACAKMLWRAFQFAFQVYTFAGGLDDRADKLTRELAHEIETDPEHQ